VNIEFRGPIWFWRGPPPWYFVTVPPQECQAIKAIAGSVTYGWGMIPAEVQLGKSVWQTSLWPKDGRYIVPIKAWVRTAEGLLEDDEVTLRLIID
jgi:hypothetical protein